MNRVFRHEHRKAGLEFLTAPKEPLQFARMCWPAGHIIQAHIHKKQGAEVLIVLSGSVRADFYNAEQRFETFMLLEPGDILLLAGDGGHGFRVLEDAEIVEVKAGPYVDDKVRFQGVA